MEISLVRRALRFLRPPNVDARMLSVMRECLRPDFNCVDVGAHAGDVLREMCRFAPRGQHYAFEPLPELYRRLVQDFPRVRVFPYALGGKEGKAIFYRTLGRSGFSGLSPRWMEQTEAITVKLNKLDDLIPLPIHFLKIDVEGAELGVLRGAQRIISEYKPIIVFEHGLNAAEYYETRPEQIYEFLSGYRIFPLGEKRNLSREQFVAEFYRNEIYDFLALPLDYPTSNTRLNQ